MIVNHRVGKRKWAPAYFGTPEHHIPALHKEVKQAFLLADDDRQPLSAQRAGDSVIVELPAITPDPCHTVVVLKIEGEPIITQADMHQASNLLQLAVARR